MGPFDLRTSIVRKNRCTATCCDTMYYCYYEVCRIITIEMKPGNNSNGTHNLTMPETVGPMMWSRKPERNLKYYEQVMLGNLIKGKEIRIK